MKSSADTPPQEKLLVDENASLRKDRDALLYQVDVLIAATAVLARAELDLRARIAELEKECATKQSQLEEVITTGLQMESRLVTAQKRVKELEANNSRFTIVDGPSIPWRLIEPHARQAEKNHGQSLAQLNGRGGLSVHEALAVLTDTHWKAVRHLPDDEARRQFMAIVEGDIRAERDALKAERDELLKPSSPNALELAETLSGLEIVYEDYCERNDQYGECSLEREETRVKIENVRADLAAYDNRGKP